MGKYEAGEFIIFADDPEGKGHSHATIQCCHCGGHFLPKVGSGKKRGFCMNCGGFVCGPGCERCVPTEQMLENMEAGRELDFKPTKIAVPSTYGEWI